MRIEWTSNHLRALAIIKAALKEAAEGDDSLKTEKDVTLFATGLVEKLGEEKIISVSQGRRYE